MAMPSQKWELAKSYSNSAHWLFYLFWGLLYWYWWFKEPWNFMTFHLNWEFQKIPTFTPWFFSGWYTTKQLLGIKWYPRLDPPILVLVQNRVAPVERIGCLHGFFGGPVSKGNFILGIVGWKFNTRSKIWWISNLFGDFCIQWVFIYTIYNIGWKACVVHKNHHDRHKMQHAAKSMGLLPGCPSDWIILIL